MKGKKKENREKYKLYPIFSFYSRSNSFCNASFS